MKGLSLIHIFFVLPVAVAVDLLRAVEFVADRAHPFLREPRFAREVEQRRDVEVRLVAVVVIGMDSRKGIDRLAAAEDALARDEERAVEAVVELLAADHLDQPVDVVGHVVGVLHGIALLESGPCRIGVEVGDEFTACLLYTSRCV